jgi:hypothetical protein
MRCADKFGTDANRFIFNNFGEPGGARTRDHRIKSAPWLRFLASPFANRGVLGQPDCTGLHRMVVIRYQTRYQTKLLPSLLVSDGSPTCLQISSELDLGNFGCSSHRLIAAWGRQRGIEWVKPVSELMIAASRY